MKKVKLVEDWRDSWRWHSTRALLALGLLPGAWLLVPEDLREAVPDEWKAGLAVVIAGAGWLGRVIDQKAGK